MFMEENAPFPENNLTADEKALRRLHLMQDIEEYISECIQHCDDQSDMIALGSVLQILSKNVLTAATDTNCWAGSVETYINDVLSEPTGYEGYRRRQWDSIPVEHYKGTFW